MAFHGQHEHSLDSKDRLTIPARFRSALADGVILVKGLDPCVEVFPLQEFARFEQREVADFSSFSRDQRRMRRRIPVFPRRVHAPEYRAIRGRDAGRGGRCRALPR